MMELFSSIIIPDLRSLAANRQDFEKISCSILLTGFSEDDIFEMVPSLAVHRALIKKSADPSSVRVAALVQALCTGLEFGHIILENQTLIEIITGTFSSPNSVLISTTWVLDFTAKMFEPLRYSAPETGYHSLGRLDQIYQAVDAAKTANMRVQSGTKKKG
ncbi:hypothetical protein B0H16DRAFT_1480245 [Mycena metata]|uniref:Uncharacterized protein n=1 Tax=Mycena metata TaxID=1033252 RepID=A0AAD7MD67_9AGAR|nr:hypothetical protein B0H16DRAFT_1480245 [Mycena metata]